MVGKELGNVPVVRHLGSFFSFQKTENSRQDKVWSDLTKKVESPWGSPK
jgi:hypothetical protein